jgi:CPA2 family monovalent cation:H+ antiporter-2
MVDRLAQLHHDRPDYEDEEAAGMIGEAKISAPAKE